MIAFLTPLLASLGIPEPFRRLVAWVGLIVLAVSALGLAKCTYDSTLIRSHDAEVTAKTVKKDSAAKEQAATERATDTATISKAQEERNHAINNGQPNNPSAASIRHNCERLRKAGADTSRIPECN